MRIAGFQKLIQSAPGDSAFHVGIRKFDRDRQIVDADIRYKGPALWDGLTLPTRILLKYHGNCQKGKRGWVAGAHSSNFSNVRALSDDGEEEPYEWKYWSRFLKSAADAVGNELDKNDPIYSRSFYENYDPSSPLDWYKTASRTAKNPRVAWAYHVTLLKNIPGIRRHGLIHNKSPNWKGTFVEDNAARGTFFSLDPEQARSWWRTLLYQASSNSGIRYERKVEEGEIPLFFPVILRFKINLNKPELQGDTRNPEERFIRDDFFVSRKIPPQGLEMWTGSRWIKDLEPEQINYKKFFSKDKSGLSKIKSPYGDELEKSRVFPPLSEFRKTPGSAKKVRANKNSPLAIDDCPTEEVSASDGQWHCEKDLRPWFGKYTMASKVGRVARRIMAIEEHEDSHSRYLKRVQNAEKKLDLGGLPPDVKIGEPDSSWKTRIQLEFTRSFTNGTRSYIRVHIPFGKGHRSFSEAEKIAKELMRRNKGAYSQAQVFRMNKFTGKGIFSDRNDYEEEPYFYPDER